jgi:hypothetical protein
MDAGAGVWDCRMDAERLAGAVGRGRALGLMPEPTFFLNMAKMYGSSCYYPLSMFCYAFGRCRGWRTVFAYVEKMCMAD